jgi:antirestriction protein ArdC
MADTRQARERLEAAVQELASSEGWTRYLETRAKFHRYSFGNVALIASQRPNATMVAGYRKWQEMGRQVRRGERGIAIFAPMVRKVETDGGDEETKVQFRIVHVFDVAQTDGEPVAQLPIRRVEDDSAEAEHVTRTLLEVARSQGLEVRTAELGGPLGSYDGHVITLSAELRASGATAKTLAHELGHHFDGAAGRIDAHSDKEIVAESVAYVVCRAAGLETAGYSAAYVLSWADSDPARLRALAERIHRVAAPILAAFESDVEMSAAA